jgi:ketosteroid isomerase-like protein
MKKRKLGLLAVLCMIAAGSAAARQTTRAKKRPSPANRIEALEARRFKAMTEKDMPTLERLLGDDLTYTHSSGLTQSKAEFIDAIRLERTRYLSIELASLSVRSYGTAAVVTGRGVFKVRSAGKEENLQLRFTDVYVMRRGRWQMVAWESTRLAP